MSGWRQALRTPPPSPDASGGPAGRCGRRRVPEKPASLWSWPPGLGAAGYQPRAASPSGGRAAGRGEGAVGGTEREMCPWAISKYFGDLVTNTSA
jgi:hypothetical protein